MRVLAVLLVAGLLGACGAPREVEAGPPTPIEPAPVRLDDLERQFGARLGVFAVNTVTGRTLQYRQDERFALLSTFKTYAVAALLKQHPLNSGYFGRRIRYTQKDLVPNSPVTSARVGTGMTVLELCAAALTKSDNTAANEILELLGGPEEITSFARALRDPATRLDRREPQLSGAVPGDKRDTSTPAALAAGYRELVLGTALAEPERAQLKQWMIANTTGDARMRAGVPPGWLTAERTGKGGYGANNDVGVTWTEHGSPIVIAVMTTKKDANAEADNQLIARAAKAAITALR